VGCVDWVNGNCVSRGGLHGYGTDGVRVNGYSEHGMDEDGGKDSGFGTWGCGCCGVCCCITGAGINGVGVRVNGHGAREHGANGLAGDGINGDGTHTRCVIGVGGHRVRECGVNGVDGDVTGDEVDGDGVMLQGVVRDGAEAHGLVDLRCPVGPCGLVRPCVGSGAGCGRWGRVLYLTLGHSYPLLLSCIYLLFSHSFLLSPQPAPPGLVV
jgi:hypothetical protein